MNTETPAAVYDAEIEIQASKWSATWSFTLKPTRSRQLSATGRMPSATRHTLLAIALTSALLSIHANEWHRLRGHKLKPSIVVKIDDKPFIRSLNFRRRSKATPTDGFRVGKNLLRPLYEQLRRFDVTLAYKATARGRTGDEMSEAERMVRRFKSYEQHAAFAPAVMTRA